MPWMHIDVDVEYTTEDEANAFMDAIVDAAYGNEPKGYDAHVSAQLKRDHPSWEDDDV